MNAIPLTDPTGIVRGWICGTCLHPGGHSERLIGLYSEGMIESARSDADECCRCRQCKRAIRLDEGRGRTCPECAAIDRAVSELNLLHPSNGPICIPCLGGGEVTCAACLGSGYQQPVTMPDSGGS
jgi:hypothetical protein